MWGLEAGGRGFLVPVFCWPLERDCLLNPERSQGSKPAPVTQPSMRSQNPGIMCTAPLHASPYPPCGTHLPSLQGTEPSLGSASLWTFPNLFWPRGCLYHCPRREFYFLPVFALHPGTPSVVRTVQWAGLCTRPDAAEVAASPPSHLQPGPFLGHWPAPRTTSLCRKQRGIYFVCKELIVINKCI